MQDRWITPWRYLFLFIFKGLQLGRINPFPPVKYLCDFNSHLTIKKAGRSTLYSTDVLYAHTNIHICAFLWLQEPQVVQGLNSFREATLWNSSSEENLKSKPASSVGDFQFINAIRSWGDYFFRLLINTQIEESHNYRRVFINPWQAAAVNRSYNYYWLNHTVCKNYLVSMDRKSFNNESNENIFRNKHFKKELKFKNVLLPIIHKHHAHKNKENGY